ncbi:HD domain-containing protein [Kandleria vitulina]|uniref:HD domain-containing protein n=1 Tax=Kandleria vitulina TaxID=1630 RepID=UPI00048DD03D|nr:HD domain-containing protein [Kandleria vitulina]
MIDLQYAKVAFKDYVSSYNEQVGAIKLKIVHTYGVMKITKELCDKMNISEEDTNLALLIALLHDIGRFEQYKKYESFVDYETVDHADFACQLLFEEGLIRKFIKDESYDDIIYHSIQQHNRYKIEHEYDERTLFFINMIRDTDKLDNFRVKETESFETLFKEEKEEVEKSDISDRVYETFMDEKLIYGPDRHTSLDMWISYVAFIFDLHFPLSKSYIDEHDYVNISFDRLTPSDNETRKKYEEMRQCALAYIKR